MICRAYQRQPGLRQPLGHCRHTSSALGSADTGGPRSFSRNSRSKGEPRGRRCRCRGAGCVSCPRAPRLRSALWAPGISISLSITACWIGAVSLSAQRMRWLPEAQCQLPSYRAACLAQSWPCRDPALHVRGSQRLAQGLLQGGIRSHSQRGLCLLPPGSLASGPPRPPPARPPCLSCRLTAKAVAVLLPLLGTSWVFGALAVNSQAVAFQYVFAALNSLQVRARWDCRLCGWTRGAACL